MTRFYFDTEFDENGKTIELISIGITTDNGKELYLVSNEFTPGRCNDFVKAKVLPHLPPLSDRAWMSRHQIRDEIRRFVQSVNDGTIEWWAYFADYDWVAFCQLFGRMVDLPVGFPQYCRDLKQIMDEWDYKREDMPRQIGAAHNALFDARWVRDSHEFILKSESDKAKSRDHFNAWVESVLCVHCMTTEHTTYDHQHLADAVDKERAGKTWVQLDNVYIDHLEAAHAESAAAKNYQSSAADMKVKIAQAVLADEVLEQAKLVRQRDADRLAIVIGKSQS